MLTPTLTPTLTPALTLSLAPSRRHEYGRGQLPLRAQEAALEATRTGAVTEITHPHPRPKPKPSPSPHQVLIKEVTRRINLRGIFQAVYTAGIVVPKPVAQCRYFYRSLNPKKLVEVGPVITP